MLSLPSRLARSPTESRTDDQRWKAMISYRQRLFKHCPSSRPAARSSTPSQGTVPDLAGTERRRVATAVCVKASSRGSVRNAAPRSARARTTRQGEIAGPQTSADLLNLDGNQALLRQPIKRLRLIGSGKKVPVCRRPLASSAPRIRRTQTQPQGRLMRCDRNAMRIQIKPFAPPEPAQLRRCRPAFMTVTNPAA
jgi:hypothetical protein